MKNIIISLIIATSAFVTTVASAHGNQLVMPIDVIKGNTHEAQQLRPVSPVTTFGCYSRQLDQGTGSVTVCEWK
jgi:hypothetical protein